MYCKCSVAVKSKYVQVLVKLVWLKLVEMSFWIFLCWPEVFLFWQPNGLWRVWRFLCGECCFTLCFVSNRQHCSKMCCWKWGLTQWETVIVCLMFLLSRMRWCCAFLHAVNVPLKGQDSVSPAPTALLLQGVHDQMSVTSYNKDVQLKKCIPLRRAGGFVGCPKKMVEQCMCVQCIKIWEVHKLNSWF